MRESAQVLHELVQVHRVSTTQNAVIVISDKESTRVYHRIPLEGEC